MTHDSLRTLYAYSTWANQRILDSALCLEPAELLADGGASFGSVRDTLVHLVSAQRVWLARCRHQPTPPALQPEDFPDVAAIYSTWEPLDEETSAFVAGLDDGALGETVHYVNSAGEPNAYPLWQILFHQINHAAQHRAEVAMILTSYDYSPGGQDFLRYLDQQSSDL
ncbi:MAG TPA: DinB family protein [Ktedonobacterales bacterium]|nr:DinB family protein [Ktedonobacterales bacterium]